MCHRPNYTHLLLREPLPTTSSALRTVDEYIEANRDQPIDIQVKSTVTNGGTAVRVFEEVSQAADSGSQRHPSCSDPFAGQMQIPAGFSRQGSAEKLTDGE
jgi:hypothetical protein